MNERISQLTEMARKGEISSPTSKSFDGQKWIDACDRLENPQPDDAYVLQAAVLIGTNMSYASLLTDGKLNFEMSRQTSFMAAVANLNYQNAIIQQKGQSAVKRELKAGVASLDKLASLPIQSGFQNLSPGDLVDSSVDATDVWLKKCCTNNRTVDGKLNYNEVIEITFKYCSIEKGYSLLWQQTIWNNWIVLDRDGVMLFAPKDIDFEKLRLAWGFRHSSKFHQSPVLSIQDWKWKMSDEERRALRRKTVISAKKLPGKSTEYIFGYHAVSKDTADKLYLTLNALQTSYLKIFMDEVLPEAGVDLKTAIHAIVIMDDLSGMLLPKASRIPLTDQRAISKWSLSISKRDVLNIFRNCLSVTEEAAESLVKFLSWDVNCYKGLWGAPLIPISNGDRFCIAQPVVSSPNMMRMAEIMMKKGGLTDEVVDNARGKPFEKHVRLEMQKAIGKNKIMHNSRCAINGIKRRGEKEEIDLLFTIGNTLVVAEVKCWMFPSDPIEYSNRMKAIKKATAQAVKKKKWVEDNLKEVEKILGLEQNNIESYTVQPLVVQNQSYGSSLVVDDIVVTDFDFLRLYMATPRYTKGGALASDGRESFFFETLYRDIKEAEDKFISTLKNPPVIERFIKRIEWGSNVFPACPGVQLRVLTGNIGDLKDDEKEFSDLMTDMWRN